MIVLAVVVCVLAEGVGRAIGYADPTTMYARLSPMIAGVVGRVLRPAVALGAAIDRALHTIIPPSAAETKTSARRRPSSFARSSPPRRTCHRPRRS